MFKLYGSPPQEQNEKLWFPSLRSRMTASRMTVKYTSNFLLRQRHHYTLKRKYMMSPSCTRYSLPSVRTSPASFAAFQLPCFKKSL